MRFTFTLFILTFNISAFSQLIIKPLDINADCKNAINIGNTTNINFSAPIGFGKENEIVSTKNDSIYFEKEHNTVWLKFSNYSDALLSFKLSPEKATDDYDFLIFEIDTTQNYCQQIKLKELKPVRTNISKTKFDGTTGLGISGTTNFVSEGNKNNFSLPINIKANNQYLMVIDNVYGSKNGFNIKLNYSPESIAIKKACVNIAIIDKQNSKQTEAKSVLLIYNKENTLDTISTSVDSTWSFNLQAGKYKIMVYKPQYLMFQEDFSIKNDDSTINLIANITKIEIGSSFKLNKVYFQGGTANFTGNSNTALRKLFVLLKENPNIKIEIQGHVNLPTKKRDKKPEVFYTQLSLDRAKAVYDYLISKGINSSQLSYTGFGYSKMIYPKAKTSDEMQKNRRVEILILSN